MMTQSYSRWAQAQSSSSSSLSPVPAELNVQTLRFSSKVSKPLIPENLRRPQCEVKDRKAETPKAGG